MSSAATLSYEFGFGSYGLSSLATPESYPTRTVVKSRTEVDASTAVYRSADESREFVAHFDKLDRVSISPSLWPEGAERPSVFAVDWAKYLLQVMEGEEFSPTRVVASGEGGVAICFVKGDEYADIECLNSGSILGVITNRRDRPLVWEVMPGEGDIARAIVRIRKFLDTSAPDANAAERSRGRWGF